MVDSLQHHLRLQKEKNRGFKAIAELKDYLYLSGVAAISESRITDYGITHILNVSVELKDFKYPVEVDSLVVEMKDSESENLLKYIDQCLHYIHTAREIGGKVLVHCVAGRSRSVSVCLAYLIKHEKLTLKEAYDLIFYERRFIYPNRGFWESLINFEEQVTGNSTVEIRPYICGEEIDLVEYETSSRILNGWMDDMFAFLSMPCLIFIIQTVFLLI